MASFPCPLESTVASALLLLSVTPPPTIKLCSEDECLLGDHGKRKSSSDSFLFSDSKSSSSSVTSEALDKEMQEIERKLNIALCRSNEVEIKVFRKSRSKLYRRSDDCKISSGGDVETSSGSGSAETSCLSSGSSRAVSSARSCTAVAGADKELAIAHEGRRRKHISCTHIRRRTDDIMKLLSSGSSSEVKIRQALGDSPDTSKALRMLLKLEEVKRSGSGGRQDPYIYMIA